MAQAHPMRLRLPSLARCSTRLVADIAMSSEASPSCMIAMPMLVVNAMRSLPSSSGVSAMRDRPDAAGDPALAVPRRSIARSRRRCKRALRRASARSCLCAMRAQRQSLRRNVGGNAVAGAEILAVLVVQRDQHHLDAEMQLRKTDQAVQAFVGNRIANVDRSQCGKRGRSSCGRAVIATPRARRVSDC